LKSTYEFLNGPYGWNRHPLAPLWCKAIIYEDGDTQGSWASQGGDGWYLGPSKDNYQCDLYYVIETCAYRVSGLTELFPQHCQLPNLTPHQYLRVLMDALTQATTLASQTTKEKRLIIYLGQKIESLLDPVPILNKQRMVEATQLQVQAEEERVINDTPIITIPCITNLPTIMQTQNPTAKCALKGTTCLHCHVTHNNTPGIMPVPDITQDRDTDTLMRLHAQQERTCRCK
jgi:hypothetical protein